MADAESGSSGCARVRRHGLPGWARQRDASVRTVEGVLADALARAPGRPPALRGGADGRGGSRARAGGLVRRRRRARAGADRRGGERHRWRPRSSSGRPVRAATASTLGSRRPRACTATGSTPGAVAGPVHGPVRVAPAGAARSLARMRAARPRTWWGSTTSRRSAGIRGPAGPRSGDLQRLSVVRDGERLDVRLPRERVPAPDGPDARRDARPAWARGELDPGGMPIIAGGPATAP